MWATPERRVVRRRGYPHTHRLPGENRTRRPVAQRLMRPFLVVETEPSADAPARLDHRAIRLDENLFVFQASPKPLDEDVVQETPFAIHADPDARCFKLIQKPGAGELYTLIA